MILTGPEIRTQIEAGKRRHGKRMLFVEETGEYLEVDRGAPIHHKMNYIDVEPYDESLVGPNSIDLRLGNELLVYKPGLERHQYLGYHHREYQIWKADCDSERERVAREGHSDGIVVLPHPPLVNTFYAVDDGIVPRGWPSLDGSIPGDSTLDLKAENKTHPLEIPEDGLILWPGILYLGRTIEVIGSNSFVPIVEGRSSVGRLGVHVHVTAGFCDLGFRGSITLEIHVLHPIKIYPHLPICQAYFLEPRGEIELYKGRYQGQVEPTASRFGVSLKDD